MRFEHTVVVPLSLPDARRLLDELERRIPVLPGLVVRVELAVVDERSTSVQLRGELPGVSGMGSTLLLDTGMRLLRRFADQVVVAARTRSAEAVRRHTGPGATAGPSAADTARDSYTFGAGRPGAEVRRLRDDPVMWALGAVGLVLVMRSLRRRPA